MKLSVVMCAYNSEQYIGAAIESILAQSYRDFEFIIVGGGFIHSDRTAELIASYQKRDSRIVVVSRYQSHAASLNLGISLAKGEYIASMDDDDISLPERLARQVAFLDANPGVGIVGTQCLYSDEINHRQYTHATPLTDAGIRAWFVRGNPFIHGSIMVRRDVMDKVSGYDGRYAAAEDYEMMMRLAAVTRMANLPEVLYVYRIRPGSITTSRNWQIARVRELIPLRYRAWRLFSGKLSEAPYVLQPIWFEVVESLPHSIRKFKRRLFNRDPLTE